MKNKIMTDEEKIAEIKSGLHMDTAKPSKMEFNFSEKVFIDDQKQNLSQLSKNNFKNNKRRMPKITYSFKR